MNGFIGEFLIMLGAFKWDPRFVVIAALGVILSAVYMLWMFQRVFYGKVTNDHNKGLPDLSFREWAIVGPLAAAAIGMGVAPNVFLKPMEPAVQRIVDRVQARQPLQRRQPCCRRSMKPKPKLPSTGAKTQAPSPRTRSARRAASACHDLQLVARRWRDDQRSVRRRHPDALRRRWPGLVVLLAEAFRGRGREDADRRPGDHRPGRRRRRRRSCSGTRNAESFGVVTADNFGLFVNLVLVVVGILTVCSRRRPSSAIGCRRASTTRSCCSPSSA